MNIKTDTYYHRSLYDKFDFNLALSNEIGLHCGTLEQANNRPGKYLYELVVDTSKMCDLTGALDIHWSGIGFLRELLGAGIINTDTYVKYVKELRDGMPVANQDEYKSEFGRKVLRTLGYTGFIYSNQVEGAGNSICIIDEGVIQAITLKEAFSNWFEDFKLYEQLWN